MPSITDDINAPVKCLLIGKSGAGKTGSLASLVAAGFNLRIIDSDKGVRPLRSLLTDPRYPYARIIAQRNIDLASAVRYIPIDTSMKLRTITSKTPDGKVSSSRLLAPTDALAWPRVIDLMDRWRDGELDLGSVRTWGLNDVLVIDSFSTLAKCVYYFSQSLNSRLGARDQGYDYQRDIGEAQAQLTRLLELLYASDINCNVVVISHITWVDETQGVANRPRTQNADGSLSLSSPDGYPSAIGRALSPQMGKYFNDVFVVRATGSGENVRRVISTVPQDGVVAKHSVYLNRDYPVPFGLAEIFCAIRGIPIPEEFPRPAAKPTTQPNPQRQAQSAPVPATAAPAKVA